MNKQKFRCQHLDEDGKRCRCVASMSSFVFSDSKVKDEWYSIDLCAKHSKTADYDHFNRGNVKKKK